MSDGQPPDEFRLDVDPGVVFDLGQSLVSDEMTALVELVKNAYDADASTVSISIDRDAKPPAGSAFQDSTGAIVVADNGTGMTAEDIRDEWLIVARSSKRAAKLTGQTTPLYERTPLGDKGLGRLGVQRLGRHVELYTSKTKVIRGQAGAPPTVEPVEDRHYLAIDWDEFRDRKALHDVPVVYRRDAGYARGTRIVITGLADPDRWLSKNLPELQARLGQFVSPFREVANFKLTGRLNGESFDLADASERLLAQASERISFSYSPNSLDIEILVRLTFIRNAQDPKDWTAFVAPDGGADFFTFLRGRGVIAGAIPERAEGDWYIRFHIAQAVDRLSGLDLAKPAESWPGGSDRPSRQGQMPLSAVPDAHGVRSIADPGPFHGEIYSFDLGRATRRDANASELSDYPQLVKQFAGVHVFRDGFGVRPYGLEGDDWLRLGDQWTGGGSYYGLKPANTLGYVSITAAANAQLHEKTDREGFTDSPESRNFLVLMRRVVKVINDTNEGVRRAFNAYVQQQKANIGEGTNEQGLASPRHALAKIRAASNEGASLVATSEPLTRSINAARKALEARPSRDQEVDGASPVGVEGLLEEAERLVELIRRHAETVGRLAALADVAEHDLDAVNEQLADLAELASLGLSVEAVTHELNNVVDNLSLRTKDIRKHLRTRPTDPDLERFVEHVSATVSTIRKQISYLSPGLRYVREQRVEFSLRKSLDDYISFQRGLGLNVSFVIAEPFVDTAIRMNQGRLTQVLDNLVLNSRYWLAQDERSGRVLEPEVHFAGEAGSLIVWDNGRGFDPTIEASAFEPFVTNKPKGEGRGLGLFIVRQLLRAAGASIDLMPERNQFGSRYRLRIDFGGAQVGSGD